MSILTDKTPIDEIKEYLQFRYNEVFSTDLFAPVDYDEVKDKIGEVALSRISADIFRRDASIILDWINENIETDAAPRIEDGATLQDIREYAVEQWGGNYKPIDAPITPEFLEGVGFEFNDDESVRISSGEGWKVIVHFGEKVTVFAGTKGALLAELPHIHTQSQLTNLIAALFGGGE